MVYSIRFSAEEKMLIEQYAALCGSTITDIIRRATMEMIEDELDVEICRMALRNYEKDPRTYSHDDIKKELGLL
jgi:predicted DNA-binding protein